MVLIGIVDGQMNLDLSTMLRVSLSSVYRRDFADMLQFGTAIRGCIEGNAKPSKVQPS